MQHFKLEIYRIFIFSSSILLENGKYNQLLWKKEIGPHLKFNLNERVLWCFKNIYKGYFPTPFPLFICTSAAPDCWEKSWKFWNIKAKSVPARFPSERGLTVNKWTSVQYLLKFLHLYWWCYSDSVVPGLLFLKSICFFFFFFFLLGHLM